MVGQPEVPASGERLAAEELAQLAVLTLECMPDAVYWVEGSGRVVHGNQAALRLSQYQRQELDGLCIWDVLPAINNPHWKELWHRLLLGKAWAFETQHRAGPKSAIPVEVTLHPLSFHERSLACVYVRDSSERQVLDSRLRQAEKMESLGRLAGGIAHDFNNQLAGILGYADLLHDQARPGSQEHSLTRSLIQAAQRAAELTDKLLAFSHQGKYVVRPTDLHLLATEVADMLARSIDRRISVRLKLNADSPWTEGDPSQLHGAVLNLALNARDAMPEGGKLTISTQSAELDHDFCVGQSFHVAPGPYICLRVEDTGSGMDEETQRRVFEPFFTTKKARLGTGLGLAAVYGTVKNHRGAVRVRSQLGQGTLFEVFLPRSKPGKTSAGSGETKIARRFAYRALVVDDEDALRDIAVQGLKKLGCTVSTATNGQEALEYFERHHHEVDFVLLDMVMPVMNGRDTFLAMQQIKPSVRVLLASGYSLARDAQELMNRGAKGFLQKPYSLRRLAKKIAEIMADGS